MKKAMSAVLACAVFAGPFGVAQAAIAQETPKAPITSVQKSSVNDVYNQYLNVLQRYKLAQDNNFYRGQYHAIDLENIGLNPNLSMSNASELFYTLVDLASDGTPELIIAELDPAYMTVPYNTYDLYGYENGSAKRIVDDLSLGYRSVYVVTENGYLENCASAGARNVIYQYLTVAPNSATPIFEQSLEYISWTGDEYYLNYGAFDYYNKYRITKDEFDGIRARYPWKQNLSWHPLDDYSNLWNELNANVIPVYVNGVQIDFDQQPIIQNDRALVPLRGIFEALGADVYWDSASRSIISSKNGTNLIMTIGRNTMYKNGVAQYLDVPPQIINDRTMVPVRVIAESFDCDVLWNSDGSIEITEK